MKTEKFVNRWAALVVGVIVLLFAGIIYAWSILKAPFLNDFHWDQGTLGLNFTIMMACFVIGGIFGGMLQKRIQPRTALWIAAALAFVGFFVSSRLTENGIGLLIVAYGILGGLGIGIVYNVVISVVSKRFPDRSTTASGVLMMGFGISTLAIGSVAGILMEQTDWRNIFLLLAVCMAVVFVIGSFFMTGGPEEAAAAEAAKAAGGNMPAKQAPPDVETKEMLKRPTFWKLYIFQILVCGIAVCVISIAKDVSVSVGNAETFAIFMVGLLSVCNGIGRIVGGFLFDRIGRRPTILLASVLAIIASLVCLFSILGEIAWLNTIGLVLVGFMYGLNPPISAGNAKSLFGAKFFPVNFPVINSMLIFASFASTIGGTLYASTGNFTAVFIMLVCFSLAGFGLFLSVRKQI